MADGRKFIETQYIIGFLETGTAPKGPSKGIKVESNTMCHKYNTL